MPHTFLCYKRSVQYRPLNRNDDASLYVNDNEENGVVKADNQE